MIDRKDKWNERKICSLFNDKQDVEDILKIYLPYNKPVVKKVWPLQKMVKCKQNLLTKFCLVKMKW